MQRPTFHYYAGLRDRPWWEIALMPTDQVVMFKEKIKTELQSILFKNQLAAFS